MIKTTCKFCGNIRLFEDSLEGQRIECLGCGFPVKVSKTDPGSAEPGIPSTGTDVPLAGKTISPAIPSREVEKVIIEPPVENPPVINTAGTEEPSNLQPLLPVYNSIENSTPTDLDYSTTPARSKPKQKTAVIILAILAITAVAFYLLYTSEGQENANATPATSLDSSIAPSNTVNTQPLTTDSNLTKSLDSVNTVNEVTTAGITDPINNTKTKEKDKPGNNAPLKDELQAGNYMFLTQGQIKNDLLNKPLCEGLVFTGYNQKLSTTGSFPDKEFQRKLHLYSNITITMRFRDEMENRSCIVEVFYKKDENKFDLITYAEK